MRKAMPLVLLTLPVCLSGPAAPAPLPKPETSAEVVFDARLEERAKAVTAFLRSHYFAQWARDDPRVKGVLPRLDGDWLKANLIVEQDGALVRVRLRGVRSRQQLEALGGALTASQDHDGPDDAQREHRHVRMLLLLENGKENVRERREIARGWRLAENGGLKMHTAPRAIRMRR
jgi:hypothetical protein